MRWGARLHAPGVHRVRLGDGLDGLAICVARGELLEVWGLGAEGLLFGVVAAAVALKLHGVVRRILGKSKE